MNAEHVAAARRITEELQALNAHLTKIGEEEVAIGKTVGTRSPASPDSLAIASARAQILYLTQVVHTIGLELAELLVRLAEEGEQGVAGD